ncbi:M23 family metallopeptidase [Bacillus cereus]|nr:M23 family metallopeptidase [Bacillus cereus]
MACPPFIINNQTPAKQYTNLPFNVPVQQIQMVTPCGTQHPGRDYLFTGATFNVTPVFAIEAGTLEYAAPGFVGIKGNDGIVTEYVHVQPTPAITKAAADTQHPQVKQISAGQQIAILGKVGEFTGPPTPHVHINRKLTWQGSDFCTHVFTCNWGIQGIDPPIGSAQCPNGWSIVNQEWKFCQNGVGQPGWQGGFFADPNGVWAGFIRLANGNIQYRPRAFRTLPSTDPNANTVLKGDFACSLDQWWFFDNNGNMVSNNIVGFNPQTRQWTVGQQGNPTHRLGTNGHCTDCGLPCSPQT